MTTKKRSRDNVIRFKTSCVWCFKEFDLLCNSLYHNICNNCWINFVPIIERRVTMWEKIKKWVSDWFSSEDVKYQIEQAKQQAEELKKQAEEEVNRHIEEAKKQFEERANAAKQYVKDKADEALKKSQERIDSFKKKK